MAILSGSGYGNGLSSSVLVTLKMAVLAPIPWASETTTNDVGPGVYTKDRIA